MVSIRTTDDESESPVRTRRNDLLKRIGVRQLQLRTTAAIADAAALWMYTRESPDAVSSIWPVEMVWVSLEPLLISLNLQSTLGLIEREGVASAKSAAVIGHIIASNTPLLGMTSVIRALLVGSASIVKLPTGTASCWLELFLEYLTNADSEVASLIDVRTWPRLETRRNRWLYENSDLIVAYGDDNTIKEISQECSIPTLGYGHKVSAAIVPADSVPPDFASNLAFDIMMFDQSGCLSPHTVFVEGDNDRALNVAELLREALDGCPLPRMPVSASREQVVTEYRTLLTMDGNAKLLPYDDSRFTVVVHNQAKLHVSPTHAFIYVVPSTKAGIIEIAMWSSALIQGMVLACSTGDTWEDWSTSLASSGIKYICQPGTIQLPTILWREDDKDVLGSLIPISVDGLAAVGQGRM